MGFPARVAFGNPVVDPAQSRLDLGLSTLALGFARGEGFGAELQLPLGAIGRFDTVNGQSVDLGVGDLEGRARYALALGPLRGSLALGAALPTGAYTARSGAAALLENARYLTLGRGTAWALADLDARLTVGTPLRLAAFGGLTSRVALADARDGFRWGPEVRGFLGLRSGAWLERVTVALSLEAQWRAQSSEVDPFLAARAPSPNTGGLWVTAVPQAQVRVGQAVAVFAAVRVPVVQQLEGFQFLSGVGVFAGIGGAFEVLPAPRPSAVTTPELGRITLVDYAADWCEPCQRLSPLLDAAQQADPRLLVRRVDATTWSAEALEAALPGVAGLPALEIFRADGSRAALLVGEDVFRFPDVLKDLKDSPP